MVMLNKHLDWLFSQSRRFKRIFSILLDTIFISTAYWGAYALRLDTLTPTLPIAHWLVLAITLPISIAGFVQLGLYRAVLRYISSQAVLTITLGAIFSMGVMISTSLFLHAATPTSIDVLYLLLTIMLCGGARIAARTLYQQSTKRFKSPVIIYGAGEAGRQLITSLHHGLEYRVVAFIDDDITLQKNAIHGVKVYKPNQLAYLVEKFKAKKLLLAMPSISKNRKREVLECLQSLPIELLSIPGLADIISGRATINDLKEISIDDLLGRDLVEPFPELLSYNINKKVVMVTGAGGSIGSELCHQILVQKPSVLILYEISEYALYQIEQQLTSVKLSQGYTSQIVPILASTLDKQRLSLVLQTFKVQTIYHTAAYKHVPLVEWNTTEGIRNNVFGTWYTAMSAVNHGVESFVLISTDKAVRPTNVMGTSKRLAELVLQALSKEQNSTCFSMVRFGNVLGSSGSVIPLFKQQILSGGPVTVTDKNITRYFMTISEAAELVIQAGAMSIGGDVFVLDMGKPVPIISLAQKMIRLMGYKIKDNHRPNGDIEIQITGLRPGEKLYEELLIGNDEKNTAHPRIKTANEVSLTWVEMSHYLKQLEHACNQNNQSKIRELLLNSITGFQPNHGVCDLVWYNQKNAIQQQINTVEA